MGVQTSWKELFLWALRESDKEKLTALVQAAEQAITLRAQEFVNSADDHEERSEMAVAHAALLSIKTHKLGWPPLSTRDGFCTDWPNQRLLGRDDSNGSNDSGGR